MNLLKSKLTIQEYPEIEITAEDLKKIIYFILMKFQTDSLHMQGTSSKRDLLGGYIERWFNKSAENIVFDGLLEDKPYTVIPDYFLYNNDSEKNAPDILGLKMKDTVVPFVKYDNGRWESIPNMPRIEVKVVRKDQSLVGVREPQMIDDYYVFIESDLAEDYLASIFAEDVFDKRHFQSLETSREFILNDEDAKIIPHKEYKRPDFIGSYKLLGIYKKDDFQKGTTFCGKKVSPYYFSDVENIVCKGNTEEKISTINGIYTYNYDDNIYLPIHIEGGKNLRLIKKHKTTFYLESEKSLKINGKELDAGTIKVSLKMFERSSNWEENVCTKDILPLTVKDSTQELIQLFDRISRA